MPLVYISRIIFDKRHVSIIAIKTIKKNDVEYQNILKTKKHNKNIKYLIKNKKINIHNNNPRQKIKLLNILQKK